MGGYARQDADEMAMVQLTPRRWATVQWTMVGRERPGVQKLPGASSCPLSAFLNSMLEHDGMEISTNARMNVESHTGYTLQMACGNYPRSRTATV